ncbi:hypothetical protein [Oryza sativa Japonica Group]|uniref:Uncharacterized protein n=1 Tax=Oryza sativa subsp. japonica TaxID=39947 RepID=Q5QN21_ORYSJ|nr:hypothetical protein [Oryza sativa Japonica Group]
MTAAAVGKYGGFALRHALARCRSAPPAAARSHATSVGRRSAPPVANRPAREEGKERNEVAS